MLIQDIIRELQAIPDDRQREVYDLIRRFRLSLEQPNSVPLPPTKPTASATDANGWPLGFFEQTFGSLPDLPERAPQGDYEQRLDLS